MRGPCHSGDVVLYSLVTGDGILLGTSSQWGRRPVIMRGPRPSGDDVLDSPVTGDGISMGTSSQWGCRNMWTDHDRATSQWGRHTVFNSDWGTGSQRGRYLNGDAVL